MTSVLVIAGHVNIENLREDGLCGRDVAVLRRGTGTGGERALTAALAPKIVEALRARGYDAQWTDASGDEFVRGRWGLLIAIHIQRDRPSSRSFAAVPDAIGVCGVPYISAQARANAQAFVDRLHNEWPILTGIPATPGDVTANMTQHYLWDLVDENTPALLHEMGHMDIDGPTLQDLPRLAAAYVFLVDEWAGAFGTVPVQPTPPPPSPIATFPVAGVWEGDVRALEQAVQMMSEGRAPAGIAADYATVGMVAKIRADVAIAQAMHETGLFAYTGTVKPGWNNFAGVGITSNEAVQTFPDVLAGVKGQIYHLAWYAHPDHVGPDCNAQVDPRHLGPHKGNVKTIADLGGKWAPSPTYGERVAKHFVTLRALVAAYLPPAPQVTVGLKLEDPRSELVPSGDGTYVYSYRATLRITT